jgi:ribosomal protein L10
MALTKDKKKEAIDEIAELLQSSKMTVVAKYQGTTIRQNFKGCCFTLLTAKTK